MAQFDVYKNLNKLTNQQIPYLLDIQNDILSDLNTRVVVPLGIKKPYNNTVNPKFIINNTEFIMITTQIAAISLNNIGTKVSSLEDNRSDIINAIDFIISGF